MRQSKNTLTYPSFFHPRCQIQMTNNFSDALVLYVYLYSYFSSILCSRKQRFREFQRTRQAGDQSKAHPVTLIYWEFIIQEHHYRLNITFFSLRPTNFYQRWQTYQPTGCDGFCFGLSAPSEVSSVRMICSWSVVQIWVSMFPKVECKILQAEMQ